MGQLKQTQVCYPVPARLRGESQKQQNTPTTAITQLTAAHPTLFHMRDGEVVLYRRTNSPTWQTRYKLKDGSWSIISCFIFYYQASYYNKSLFVAN